MTTDMLLERIEAAAKGAPGGPYTLEWTDTLQSHPTAILDKAGDDALAPRLWVGPNGIVQAILDNLSGNGVEAVELAKQMDPDLVLALVEVAKQAVAWQRAGAHRLGPALEALARLATARPL